MATLELGGRAFTVTPFGAADGTALASAFRRLTGREWPTEGQLRLAARSLDGSRAVILHKLRQFDPTVTAEWVAEHVPDIGTAHDVYAALRLAHTA